MQFRVISEKEATRIRREASASRVRHHGSKPRDLPLSAADKDWLAKVLARL